MPEIPGYAIKWLLEYIKLPVAFGIFKLVIGCIIVDTVSIGNINQQIQEMKGLVEVRNEEEAQVKRVEGPPRRGLVQNFPFRTI
jgi:translation elongation factor EF-1beta